MTLINEEPTRRKTTRVLLAKMSAGALMAFCELLERGDLEQGDELVYVNLGFEWPEQEQAAEALKAICKEKLIKFTELQGHLEYEMLHKSIEKLYRPRDASRNLQWQGFVQRLQRGRCIAARDDLAPGLTQAHVGAAHAGIGQQENVEAALVGRGLCVHRILGFSDAKGGAPETPG